VSASATMAAGNASDGSGQENGQLLGDLLCRARDRDGAAWDELVARLGNVVLHTARAAGLQPSDAADAAQLTWLRLLEHIHDIREPEHLPGWLKVTTRREALRVAMSGKRHVLCAELDASHSGRPGLAVTDYYPVEDEYSAAVAVALAQLPPRYEKLLRLLTSDDCPSYAEAAAKLGLPIGSVGPMRMRALTMLRQALGQASQPDELATGRGASERAGSGGGLELVAAAA
jgi:DNA-directed RNA polymerase specialized sigma24 family protein